MGEELANINEAEETRSEISIFIVKVAVIAAVYAAVTIAIAPIAFGPIQFRISDALMPIPYLPYFGLAGVIGLTLGTLIANILSPYGLIDMILGSIANFVGGLGAYYARRIRNKVLGRIVAVMIPIIVITFLIGFILLTVIFGGDLLMSVGGVFVSELIIIGVFGYILIARLEKVLGSTDQ